MNHRLHLTGFLLVSLSELFESLMGRPVSVAWLDSANLNRSVCDSESEHDMNVSVETSSKDVLDFDTKLLWFGSSDETLGAAASAAEHIGSGRETVEVVTTCCGTAKLRRSCDRHRMTESSETFWTPGIKMICGVVATLCVENCDVPLPPRRPNDRPGLAAKFSAMAPVDLASTVVSRSGNAGTKEGVKVEADGMETVLDTVAAGAMIS